ncbi:MULTISPECIES: hypothetical protein [Pseudomonas]|uniref:hypothetical protein n=1 Tax=Pseudomonas TaxID=286 RepID=UPI0009BD2036|nr:MULTISPECIES: hypothetical protein [Pseudomonas]
MTIRKVDFVELSRLIGELSGMVDFKKDLPTNLFVGNGFKFWFFERPLLDFVDVFSELVSESLSSFGGDVFIKFSGEEFLVDSCFAINGDTVDADASWVSDNFEDFFGGRVGYPVVLFNGAFDWVAFESLREEFGVIAVKVSSFQNGFFEYLESNFISCDGLSKMSSSSSVEGLIAKAFEFSYCRKK